jgi:AcrR family transcriptional regulator
MARSIAKDHDAKRAQILTAAARVFADEGYHRASMSQLAAACGISKANIYHYYDSKDALLFDMLDSYLAGLRDRIAAVDGQGMRAEEHLQAVVEAMKPYARHGLNVNVDFYSGVIYQLHGIPMDLYVPIFAIGRMPGWIVQCAEQQRQNILIRPLTLYNGPEPRAWLPLEDR